MTHLKNEPANRIGFISSPFPEIKGTKFAAKTYKLKCLHFTIEVEVYQCRLKLGESSFTGICTSEVNVGRLLPLSGFASHCHLDESKTMFDAVRIYCEEHGMEMINQYNNWPSFRGAANKITSQTAQNKDQ